MATAAVSIIDRLIQLATVRERNRERFFKNFVEPLYTDGEKIAQDYMALLTDLIHLIADAQDARKIIEWLETRRMALKPLRDKVREVIRENPSALKNERGSKELKLLKQGLWGVMRGAASAVEDGHALTGDYGFSDHTVLDLLHRARIAMIDQRSRELLTRRARQQQAAIERAWRDVATAYAALRLAYLS